MMRDQHVVFIAGPMTGFPDYNRQEFHLAANDLRKSGFIVLNPAVLPDGLGESSAYLHITLSMVDLADCIYALRGWERSRGAVQEVAKGVSNGLQVLYQEDEHSQKRTEDSLKSPSETIVRIVQQGSATS